MIFRHNTKALSTNNNKNNNNTSNSRTILNSSFLNLNIQNEQLQQKCQAQEYRTNFDANSTRELRNSTSISSSSFISPQQQPLNYCGFKEPQENSFTDRNYSEQQQNFSPILMSNAIYCEDVFNASSNVNR